MDHEASAYLTASDVARLAQGDLTPAGVRLAAATGRLRIATVTAGGVRLFERADALAFLAARRARRRAA